MRGQSPRILSLRRCTSGDIERALTYAQQVLAIQPNPAAHTLIARVYLRRGETARRDGNLGLQKAYPHRQPVSRSTHSSLRTGSCLPRALLTIARCISTRPIWRRCGASGIDLASGHPKEAVARLDAALARKEPTVEFLLLAGRGYASAGNAGRAKIRFGEPSSSSRIGCKAIRCSGSCMPSRSVSTRPAAVPGCLEAQPEICCREHHGGHAVRGAGQVCRG